MSDERTVRAAFERALAAHLRAATTHDEAADFYDRWGRGDAAAREREKAIAERAAHEAASALRPDWVSATG